MKPWMTDYQIDMIQSYLNTKQIMLEYGAGGSTLYFSKYVSQYISIEHDSHWIEKIKNLIKQPSNVDIHYCKPNNPISLPVWVGSQEDFKDYINCVDKLKYKKYDIVLIDGRARQYCGKKILNYIDKKSIIFVHDFFERPRYRVLLNYYDVIDEDQSANKPTLVVLKKKPQFDDT